MVDTTVLRNIIDGNWGQRFFNIKIFKDYSSACFVTWDI